MHGTTDANESPELTALYEDFASENLIPLWKEISGLMPESPQSHALAHLWRWTSLLPVAERAGALVPVGRGGERRAIALANPGLAGRPFATPTLWAAIQYLNPHEDAPVHRHTQHAFRFVIEGEGVWTVVGGDAVAMRRGDFLPQGGLNWHGHHNASDKPMAWIDGLDIPFQRYIDSTFFEFGPTEVETRDTPSLSRSERLWAHPGLRPLTQLAPSSASPLLAYRWEFTDRALTEQLALEREGYSATTEPGHAAVRYVNPTNGADVMPTIRAEFHRLAPGTETAAKQEVGSSVYQVFEGSGEVQVGDVRWSVGHGDMFVVPSWQALSMRSELGIDLFAFSDAPILEALHLNRSLYAR
jgi:gentisate 1,2-dioxygenase